MCESEAERRTSGVKTPMLDAINGEVSLMLLIYNGSHG